MLLYVSIELVECFLKMYCSGLSMLSSGTTVYQGHMHVAAASYRLCTVLLTYVRMYLSCSGLLCTVHVCHGD